MYISCQIRGPFEWEERGSMDPCPKVSADIFLGQNSSLKVKVGTVSKLNLMNASILAISFLCSLKIYPALALFRDSFCLS